MSVQGYPRYSPVLGDRGLSRSQLSTLRGRGRGCAKLFPVLGVRLDPELAQARAAGRGEAMTRDQIIERLQRAGVTRLDAHVAHPAFEHFVSQMRDKQYGPDPCLQAWLFFASGWDAVGTEPAP